MNRLPGDPADPSPATASAGVALLAIIGACFAGSMGPIQTAPLLVETAGLTIYVGGILLRRRSYRVPGTVLTVCGLVIAAVALIGATALSMPLPTLLTLLSCGLGALLATLGLVPVSVRFTWTFTGLGIAFVFGGVATNTIFESIPLWRSAVAVTLVYFSWDASGRAITLGEQVGSAAETISVELTATATSIAVAMTAVVLTIAVARIPVDRSSLIGLAFLLIAIIAFFLSLSHVPHLSDARNDNN